jgi:hypothetical protein
MVLLVLILEPILIAIPSTAKVSSKNLLAQLPKKGAALLFEPFIKIAL